MGKEKAAIPSWKVPAAAGYALITATFFVMGGWSAIAKLDSAVTAQGVVATETNRKTVQHLEGGIIREILVREGQHVDRGQVLFRLDVTQSQAGYDLQRGQLDFAVAQESRLLAERDGLETIAFPKELEDRKTDPAVGRAISDQLSEFRQRKESLKGQVDIYQSRIEQFKTEIGGLKVERDASTSQLKFIKEELDDTRYLFSQNLTQKSKLLSLERESSRLAGVIGRSTADQAKAENGIGEANLQISQIRQKFLEEVGSAIVEVRAKIADLREKVRVASDVLSRQDILSPSTGVAQNLKVFTTGGVIRPGEPMVDVVPENDELIVQAHVSPIDIDSVVPGMTAEIRFSSFHTQFLPIMSGRVSSVSRDRILDEQTKQPYFLAQVVATNVPDDLKQRLSAGMPADLVFPTGERTVMEYLVRPLQERMRSAMREK
jgi:HlyD family type I secretion membrane fusion protein